MESGTGAYVLFLVIGIVAIVVDGQFLRRSGAAYLEEVFAEPRAADSYNRLVAVLFHLTLLGVLALISVVEFPTADPITDVVSHIGVLLLVMALAHGITTWAFARARLRQREQRLGREIALRTRGLDADDRPRHRGATAEPSAGE